MSSEADELDAATRGEKFLRALFLGLLLAAATIAAYQQVWHAGFIWDDDVYVTANKLLTAPDGLKRIWLSLDSPSQYFPLVYTTFRLEHALWGLNAAGYHWVNIILHLANALLLWRVLYALRIPGAWLAAGLFALHPVQVESVAWITERKNVLMGFFYLLALLAWLKFVAGEERGKLRFYLLALLLFALALFSKTTACTLPIAFLLISWLKRGAITAQRVVQVLPFVVLGIAMGLVSVWWERFHQGTQGQLFSLGILERMLVSARAFWFYLGKLVWPAELAFSYPRWQISAADPSAYIWPGACLALGLVIWLLRRVLGRGPEVAFLFFFVTLSPTLGFVMLYTFRYSFVADHYQYLASIGPLTLVAAGLATAINQLGRLRSVILPILCAALLVPLGWRTWRQGAVYMNEETLWRANLAVNPGSWVTHNNLAVKLLNSDRTDEAIWHFEEALRIDPNYAEAEYNLANAFLRQGRPQLARPHYEKALALNPNMPMARANLATLLSQNGDTQSAMAQLDEAVKTDPGDANTRTRLGEALLREGKSDEALTQFRAALELDPNAFQANQQIAALYLGRGRVREAREFAQRAVAADPNDATAQTNLGIILSESGDDPEATAHLQKAIEIDPQSAEAWYNLGNTLLHKQDADGAIEKYRRALAIRPDYGAARLNLANVLAETNRLPEAVTEYENVLRLRPDYALAHKNLAAVLNRLGRYSEATDHLQASWRAEAESRKTVP